jgi:hypothetical protein
MQGSKGLDTEWCDGESEIDREDTHVAVSNGEAVFSSFIPTTHTIMRFFLSALLLPPLKPSRQARGRHFYGMETSDSNHHTHPYIHSSIHTHSHMPKRSKPQQKVAVGRCIMSELPHSHDPLEAQIKAD